MVDIVPLEPSRLGDLRWSKPTTYEFAVRRAFVPIARSEILRIAHDGPILLLCHRGGARPVLLLSDSVEQTGRFIDRQFRWRFSYVPLALRMYPFCFDDDVAIELDPEFVAVDGSHPLVNSSRGLSVEAETMLHQVRSAWSQSVDLNAAARLLVAEVSRPWKHGPPGLDLRVVDPERLQAATADRAGLATLTASGTLALELAIAARFSRMHLPNASSQQRVPVPAPAEAARPAESAFVPLHHPSPPADLTWLDTGAKLTF